MATRNRLWISVIAVVVMLVGCGTYILPEVSDVSSTTVTQTIRYTEEGRVGAEYTFMVTVPDDWVNTFDVRNTGSKVVFRYTPGGERPAAIFDIQALSRSQFWEQNGSYPQSYKSIQSSIGDTYFIYYVPVDAYYSGLSAEQYAEFTRAVPEIIRSFRVERTNNPMMGQDNF